MSDAQERLERLVVAVSEVPARCRGVLDRVGDLDEIDAMLRDRCEPTSWSVLEHVNYVADALHSSAKHVIAVVDGEASRRIPVPMEGPRAGSSSVPSRVVLAALNASAIDLARAASNVALERSGPPAGGEEILAAVGDVLEDALGVADVHLTEVETLLEAAVRHRVQPV